MSLNSASLTPATPIRAIQSTLLSRTAPTIPLASQLYEPLVKGVLRHRLYKIFLHSGLFCWFLVTTWTTWSSARGSGNLLLMPVKPSTLAYTAVTFCAGVLPVVVLRKSHIASAPTSATSPSKTFSAALQKPHTAHAFLTYILSSLTLAILHILITGAYEASVEPHSRLSLFVKSRKHPYYLNGHLIYILFSQAFVACACLLRCVLLDRFSVRWTFSKSPSGEKLQTFGLARVVTVALTTFVYTLVVTIAYLLAFAIARSAALPMLYWLPFIPKLLKPFTAHFLRGQYTLMLLRSHWALVSRAFYLALSTVGVWEFVESAFDAIVTQPANVATHTADSGLTLVSGIASTDGYIKHFAYTELRDFAAEDSPTASARRTTLFGDQKYSPNMWTTLARDSLLTLGRDYQLFLRRGQPESPAPAVPAEQSKPSVPLPTSATPLLRTSVFKPAQTSPLRAALDTFASDGPLATAVSETADAGVSHIPELFRSVMPATPPGAAAIETVKKAEENVSAIVSQTKGKWREGAGKALSAYIPRNLARIAAQGRTWWTRERIHRVAETSLPNRHLDALAAEVLCHLTCASLTEDRYGVVQRDIPKIIEALLSFLSAIEEYQADINAKYAMPEPERLRELSPMEIGEKETLAMEAARAHEVVSVVSDAIKDGIVQIVRTFGDKLTAFRFPPRIAKKLQGFVDYS